jgi:oligoribonuclease (3'-5' exoribonuclease)
MLVTDENLSVVSPDFCIVIKQDDETLNNMNDWCKENLKDLAEASRKSCKLFYDLTFANHFNLIKLCKLQN